MKFNFKLDEIGIEFFHHAIIHKGIYLFSDDDAKAVIGRCEENGRKILGVDAFKFQEGGKIQPFSEHSVDYSDAKENNGGCWIEAKDFIASKLGFGLYFEIIYE